MRGMIITVLHCREKEERERRGERKNGEGKGHEVQEKGGKCGSRNEGVGWYEEGKVVGQRERREK